MQFPGGMRFPSGGLKMGQGGQEAKGETLKQYVGGYQLDLGHSTLT
jgi:hypothetical protein